MWKTSSATSFSGGRWRLDETNHQVFTGDNVWFYLQKKGWTRDDKGVWMSTYNLTEMYWTRNSSMSVCFSFIPWSVDGWTQTKYLTQWIIYFTTCKGQDISNLKKLEECKPQLKNHVKSYDFIWPGGLFSSNQVPNFVLSIASRTLLVLNDRRLANTFRCPFLCITWRWRLTGGGGCNLWPFIEDSEKKLNAEKSCLLSFGYIILLYTFIYTTVYIMFWFAHCPPKSRWRGLVVQKQQVLPCRPAAMVKKHRLQVNLRNSGASKNNNILFWFHVEKWNENTCVFFWTDVDLFDFLVEKR